MKNNFNVRLQKQELLKQSAEMKLNSLLSVLDSSLTGLTSEEVEKKSKIYGSNTVTTKSFIWYKKFLHCLFNPFVLVLTAIGTFDVIQYIWITKDRTDLIGIVIVAIMIVLSVTITYFQDYRSYKSAEKLKSMVTTTTSVLRNYHAEVASYDPSNLAFLRNHSIEVKVDDLVPGDIIFLQAGDLVPADIRILHASDLFINQATLTGESELVEKFSTLKYQTNNVLETSNLAFMGTSVNAGSCIALVLHTGKSTYLGQIARAIEQKMPKNAFNRGISRITYLLIGFMLVMVPIVFVINWVTKNDIAAALLFALSVAVGLTPEMLPMIVSANLARGAVRMSKEKVIVKNLTAIQSFGEMDVLCTDKTGTLTADEIELVEHLDASGKENLAVLEMAYLNSFYQTGWKNNIDKTVIAHIKAHHDPITNHNYYKVDEIPFDFSRRRMSVVVSKTNEHKHTLITKGAVEEILSICTHVKLADKVVELDDSIKRQVLSLSKKLNQQGLRVIAVCYKDYQQYRDTFSVNDEEEMVLSGYIGFLDVPKESSIKAIKSLAQHGVQVKILTGDNEIVTQAICKKIGLDPGKPLLGSEIVQMNDEQLKKIIEKTTIFAKLEPLQKAKIIALLKDNNHTVGFMGDGINDAVALKIADIGVCVDSGVEIAKEVADVILLEKDLNVLEQGVILGRHTFANIIKYIKITMASNFGNVFSVLVASIWLPFQPMASLQLLFQNLLYDISQVAIPWDRVDPEYLQKPRKWEAKSFATFAFWNGPLSSVFDITTFLFMGLFLGTLAKYAVDPNNPSNVALFQSGWFVLGLISQTMIVHLCRTSKVPIIQSRSTWPLGLMTLAICVIALVLPFTYLGSLIGLVALPAIYFAYLFIALVSYFILNQGLKLVYKKIYHRWL